MAFAPKKIWHKKRQPKGPQAINWALSLVEDLEFAVIAPTTTGPDIARGITVNTVTGTIGYGNTEHGEGLNFLAEANRSVSYNAPLLSPPFTCIVGYKLNAIPADSRNVVGNYINNTSGFRITPNATNFRAQFGRAGAAQIITGSAIAVGNKIDAVVADDSTFKYYENGALSVSAAQAGWAAPTNLLAIGGANSPIMTVAFVYYFSRALRADEIAEIYEAPYKILLPSVRILLVDSGIASHDASGDIVGSSALMSGELTHALPGFSASGDIVGSTAVMTGSLTHHLIVDHELTGDLVASGSPSIDGVFDNDQNPSGPVIITTYGGDGRPITKCKRRPSANEELDLLFKDIINEFFGLNDVEELEDVIDSLPITFDIDLEAMTRIEEIKYLMAAYEQYLDDEAAAEILLMG